MISTIKRILSDHTDDVEETVMTILDRLDTNDGKELSVAGKPCCIVNVARLDNVCLGTKILEKVLAPDLWLQCDVCENYLGCPINNNRLTASRALPRLSRFVTAYYRYLQEQDNRLTVRQIASHLTFTLTGNLVCSDIPYLREPDLFKYHMGNLFFGYLEFKSLDSARQIRAISELQRLGMDSISLSADYQLFVKKDFSCFEENVAYILAATDDRAHRIKNLEKRKWINEQFRRSVRRFYILLAILDDQQHDALLGELFSPVYPIYLRAISRQLSHLEKLDLQDLVFEALYTTYIGSPASGQNEIHLGVRRSNIVTQYVQLLKGSVNKSHLTIKQSLNNGAFDLDESTYALDLQFRKLAVPFRLNYPLLEHFWQVANGAVNTALSPALTHGIDRLKAQLISGYSEEADQSAINLLVQTSKGARKVSCQIADGYLCVE